MLKIVFGVVASILTLISYVPYIKGILRGVVRPHFYSWFLWSLTGFITFFLQAANGGGFGAFVTLASSCMCLTVLVLGVVKRVQIKNTLKDIALLVLALIALILWQVVNDPILSIILLLVVGLSGMTSTVIKAWHEPYSETISLYLFSMLNSFFTFFALDNYCFVTMLNPLVWVVVNGGFAIMLEIQRRKLRGKKLLNNRESNLNVAI